MASTVDSINRLTQIVLMTARDSKRRAAAEEGRRRPF
jgi:hypothetical protein